MTTDVINGVPRELLEQVTIELEHDTDRYMLGRELRALLATAQPADHSEHDLNMVSQPAADGEREAFEAWLPTVHPAANNRTFSRSGEQYAYTPAASYWPAFKAGVAYARAAQPQQAVAVTDEVRHVPLYEAVERACGELPDGWAITLQMERGAGWIELYDAEGVEVADFPTNNERLDYTLLDAVDAALSAHKTGGEE